MITGVGGEAMTASMKLQTFITPLNIWKFYLFLQAHVLLFPTKWGKKKRNWLCYSFKYRQSILHPMQAVFSRR